MGGRRSVTPRSWCVAGWGRRGEGGGGGNHTGRQHLFHEVAAMGSSATVTCVTSASAHATATGFHHKLCIATPGGRLFRVVSPAPRDVVCGQTNTLHPPPSLCSGMTCACSPMANACHSQGHTSGTTCLTARATATVSTSSALREAPLHRLPAGRVTSVQMMLHTALHLEGTSLLCSHGDAQARVPRVSNLCVHARGDTASFTPCH